MRRRNLLKSGIASALLATLSPKTVASLMRRGPRGLFFDENDLPRIRENANHPLLRADYIGFRDAPLLDERSILERARESKDYVNDLRDLTEMLNRQSLLLVLGDASDERRALVRDSLEAFLGLTQWDYFRDGRGHVLGFQRAPASIISTLFSATALGKEADDLQRRLMADLPGKGCEPCYWSLWGMQHKQTTKDWRFDPDYYANYDVDLSNWPMILDKTNLKAIPIAGLGLAALALKDIHPDYDRWMGMAVTSARSYLELFKPDGSYFEGIGYADYSLRNLFIFFEAHLRLEGSIDWSDLVNYYGFAEYAVCMQMGARLGGTRRDIVNFSDANSSFIPSTALWIANHAGDPLAQYAALHFAERRDFTDWLWLDSARSSVPPMDRLKNKRFDLDWVVCRTGWAEDDNVLAFRSGQPSNHEHADRNSLIFKAYGERLLTDHYGASYDWRQKGWLLRLTEAHNSVLIDGKGHQYHDGSEGTPPSKASASIVRYVDRGELVFWTSDATPAYQLVHPTVTMVYRSVCFLKPDLVLVVDSVEASTDVTVSLRFHPDNSDGLATLTVHGSGFQVVRPKASLTASINGLHGVRVTKGVLDVPAADLAHLGDGKVEARNRDASYVFVDAEAPAAHRVDLLSVCVASRGLRESEIRVERTQRGWSIQTAAGGAEVFMTGTVPEFSQTI